jgi:hypothetical protein
MQTGITAAQTRQILFQLFDDSVLNGGDAIADARFFRILDALLPPGDMEALLYQAQQKGTIQILADFRTAFGSSPCVKFLDYIELKAE